MSGKHFNEPRCKDEECALALLVDYVARHQHREPTEAEVEDLLMRVRLGLPHYPPRIERVRELAG